MTDVPEPLDFTGERFTPECQREIWYEHYHRYAIASRWVDGLRILDAACGEGYGSALLSKSAASVAAIDISDKAIAHAQQRYGDLSNLDFQVANCTSLPFADNEFDCITSFETLEHLEEHDQLLSEFKRVLKPDGFLAISSPDKAIYTDKYQTENEFHVKELYRHELESLIGRHFKTCRLLGQKLAFHSAIWSLGVADSASTDTPGDKAPATKLEKIALDQVTLDQSGNEEHHCLDSINQPAMYFIALCADAEENLPPSTGQLWLFDDLDESVYRHYHGEISHNIMAGGVIADLEKQIDSLKQQLRDQQQGHQQQGLQQEGHQQEGHQQQHTSQQRTHLSSAEQAVPRRPRNWWQRLLSKS